VIALADGIRTVLVGGEMELYFISPLPLLPVKETASIAFSLPLACLESRSDASIIFFGTVEWLLFSLPIGGMFMSSMICSRSTLVSSTSFLLRPRFENRFEKNEPNGIHSSVEALIRTSARLFLRAFGFTLKITKKKTSRRGFAAYVFRRVVVHAAKESFSTQREKAQTNWLSQ
jgi:hypothetical protein